MKLFAFIELIRASLSARDVLVSLLALTLACHVARVPQCADLSHWRVVVSSQSKLATLPERLMVDQINVDARLESQEPHESQEAVKQLNITGDKVLPEQPQPQKQVTVASTRNAAELESQPHESMLRILKNGSVLTRVQPLENGGRRKLAGSSSSYNAAPGRSGPARASPTGSGAGSPGPSQGRRFPSLALYTAPIGYNTTMTALKRAVLSWLRLAPPPYTPHVYLIGSHPLNYSRPHLSLVWLARQFPRHVHAIGGKGEMVGGGMQGGGVDVTYDGVTKMNSLFALAMREQWADVAAVIDPDVVLLGDVMAAVARLTWILTSSLWRVSWFPFVLDNLPPEIQPANHKPPAGVDEAGVRRFLRRHAELDSGGPVGFVMWSQRHFREATFSAETKAAAGDVGASSASNRNGLQVSLFSEPMPPFLYGRGPQGWQWVLRQLAVGMEGRDGKVGGVSREGMVHVVDGTGAVSAVRIDPHYDSVKEAERVRGGAEQSRGMGGGDGESGRSGRWVALPAVHSATWHGQVNEMLLRGGVGDWGEGLGEGRREGRGEGQGTEGAIGGMREGVGGEEEGEEGEEIAWEWERLGGEPTVAHLRWHLAMCHGPGGEHPCLMRRIRPGICPCEHAHASRRSSLPSAPFRAGPYFACSPEPPPPPPRPVLAISMPNTSLSARAKTISAERGEVRRVGGEGREGGERRERGNGRTEGGQGDEEGEVEVVRARGLEEVVGEVADGNKAVVLVAATHHYASMLLSFACMWVRHSFMCLSNLLVAALDPTAYRIALLHGLPVLYDNTTAAAALPAGAQGADGAEGAEGLGAGGCAFNSHCFRHYTKLKSRAVLRVLRLGYAVLWSDVDVVWFDNPLPLLWQYGEGVLAIQSNEPDPSLPPNSIRRINSGFYLARPDPLTVAALTAVVKHAAHSRLSEQPSFYDVLCGEHGERRVGSDACQWTNGLRVVFLPRQHFPNGAVYQLWGPREGDAGSGQGEVLSGADGQGEVVSAGDASAREECERRGGHGTREGEEGQVCATVCGVVKRINRLLSVQPLKTWYVAQTGDVVVGRVTELAPKRWKLAVGSAHEAQLMLSAINLPGGAQRRRTAVDELNMRNIYVEGDLVTAEVQRVFHDGSVVLHTRSDKYGKLSGGLLVHVPPYLVRRLKQHFHMLSPSGPLLVFGCNGWLWVGQPPPPTSSSGPSGTQGEGASGGVGGGAGGKGVAETVVGVEERERICRVAAAIRALERGGLAVDPPALARVVEWSVAMGVSVAEMGDEDFVATVVEKEVEKREADAAEGS
ncbi:unnamed protein product [Closterium sp. Naga37s-1]|nr:unnamed protein product [Closterium sp. Naga37s-1]